MFFFLGSFPHATFFLPQKKMLQGSQPPKTSQLTVLLRTKKKNTHRYCESVNGDRTSPQPQFWWRCVLGAMLPEVTWSSLWWKLNASTGGLTGCAWIFFCDEIVWFLNVDTCWCIFLFWSWHGDLFFPFLDLFCHFEVNLIRVWFQVILQVCLLKQRFLVISHQTSACFCFLWIRTCPAEFQSGWVQLAICQVHMSAYPPAELTMAGRGDDETSFKQLSCQQLLAARNSRWKGQGMNVKTLTLFNSSAMKSHFGNQDGPIDSKKI